MNIGLYREIISKLNELSVEEAKAENVRNLMGTWSNRAYQRDIISVLCAFYAYMDEKNEYNFIHTIPDWQNFFRERFSSYFKIDKIKADFDDIIFAEKVTDIILKFADKETLKEFYEYAKLQNDFYMKNNNNKYKSYFELLESKCVSMGIVEKTIEVDIPQIDSISESTNVKEITEEIKRLNPNANISIDNTGFSPKLYSSIPMNQLVLPKGFYVNEKNGITNKHNTKSGMYCSIDVVDMSMQQQPTNTQSNLMTAAVLNSNFQNAARAMETHRENVFAPAADALGVDKSTLVNMVGNSESYKIDDIDIAPELIGMLKSNDSKVASIPKGMYAVMKNRISEKKFLRNIELDFIKENGLTTLKLSKKDTIFDKIASTSKEVINKIKKSAKEKAKTAMDFGSSSIGTIKNAILNTSTIVKQKAKDIEKSAEKALYNTVVAAGTAQMEIQDFAADKKEQVSQKKDELASKTADKLRSFADRIGPSSDIVIEAKQKVEPVVAPITTEAPKETTTYINTPQGRAKVVLRAATKAGEIPVIENKSRSIM